jgi:hypothetical protein
MLFTVRPRACSVLLQVQDRQQDGESVREAFSDVSCLLLGKGFRHSPFLHCHCRKTIDSSGKGAQPVELASDLLGYGSEADGCEALRGLTDKVIAIVWEQCQSHSDGSSFGLDMEIAGRLNDQSSAGDVQLSLVRPWQSAGRPE